LREKYGWDRKGLSKNQVMNPGRKKIRAKPIYVSSSINDLWVE